nr:MafI family immunity protein [Hymenobacter rubidus]
MVLAGAATLGLPQRDIQNAQEMLDYDEYQLGFDIIVVQLHEFEIEITEQYFLLLEQVANRLQIPATKYVFVKELIRSPKHIPKPVSDKLSLLLQMLKEQ